MGQPEVPLSPTHTKLRSIRGRTDLKLRPTKHLKTTFTGFDGVEKPLSIRYYQVQGILHLVAMNRFLLGDDTGLGKCVPLSTRVLTNEGLIPLRDLAPKGIPLTPDTFYPLDRPVQVWTGWKWASVKRYYHCGVKPTKTVRTRRGYETTGSFVHPLWSRQSNGESFIEMKDIREGEFLGLSRKTDRGFPFVEPKLPVPSHTEPNERGYPVRSDLNPDLAALLGYIVTEGWTNSRQAFTITQHRDLNPETHDHIRSLCASQFGWEGNATAESKDTTIHISSTFLRAYLKGLGVDMGLSETKRVPWPIFQGTSASVAAFLRAFFDGEGSVENDVIEVSSASEHMLKEIQVLLLRFGIVCSRSPKKVNGYEHNNYWRVTICGDDARRFHASIGFLTPRKQESLAGLLSKPSNANLDVVPHAQDQVEAIREEILKASTRAGANADRKGSGIKQFGVSFEKTLNNIRNADRNPTYAFLEKLLAVSASLGLQETKAYRDIESVCQSRFFYDPVEEIIDGEAEVADIEVDDADHSFVANGFINHNTLESIAALCYIWEKDPNRKVIILTTKSAAPQWVREFGKFTTGVKVIACQGSRAQRDAARKMFRASKGPTVIVMGYRSAVQDFTAMQDWSEHILIADEATAFKTPTTQVHQVVKHLSGAAARTWGLTATLIKNNLMEGYGIYQVIVPGLFGMNKNQFMLYYCLCRMQPIPRSNRQIPVIIGYTPDRIDEFKAQIDPYYIGRAKHDVASDLPSLIMQEIEVDLTPQQEAKYAEALAGLLEVGGGGSPTEQTVAVSETEDRTVAPGNQLKEVTKLTAIIYCQQIINSPELIGIEGESAKLEALIDLLTEGDLADEKVIVFSRFKKMIDIIMPRLAKEKVKAVRITGDENTAQRDAAMTAFQNPKSDVRVACLTTAGSEAINLQAAKALVCFDTPWSAGEFLQLIGRMLRIGSLHDSCTVIHLVSKGSGKFAKTVDHRVLEVLGKKMTLVEAVLGKRIKGTGDSTIIPAENEISDLFKSLAFDAKNLGTK